MLNIPSALRASFAPVLAALVLTACVPGTSKLASLTAMLPDMGAAPAMQWDHRPEATEWTQNTLLAVARHDDVLAARVPGDIKGWCPGYEAASVQNRRAFWVGLISTVGKYESSWNPAASGGGGRYIGVMQISPKSARNYGCDTTSVSGLKNGTANLQCAVELVAYHVARDGQVAGKGNRGIGRDWMPLRKASKRSAMAAWTSQQAYCN